MKTLPLSRKGFASGCCLFLALGALLLIIGGVVFYFAVWRVPDYSIEARQAVERVESRLAEKSRIEDENNGWKYYQEAAVKMDFSSLEQKGDSSPAGSENHSQKITRLTEIATKGPGPEQKKQLKEFFENNTESLELSARGFMALGFFNVPAGFDFDPVNPGNPSSNVENELKIQALGYFLLISGMMESSSEQYLGAARRYMESIRLYENYRGSFSGLVGIAQKSYGMMAWEKLAALMNRDDLPGEVVDFVSANLWRIAPEPMEYQLDYHFYANEMMMDQVIKSPQLNTAAFLLERERKVSRGLMIKVLEEYRKDPVAFPDTVKSMKPGKLSIYEALACRYLEGLCHTAYNRQTYYNGLMIMTALHKYRRDYGSYPDKLSQLTPGYLSEIPADPYDSEGSFGYEKSGDGVLLYSSGPNHQDDKGKGDDIILMGKSKTDTDSENRNDPEDPHDD